MVRVIEVYAILSVISFSLAIAYLATKIKPLLIAARVIGGFIVGSFILVGVFAGE